VRQYAPEGADVDSVIDVRAISQQGHRDLSARYIGRIYQGSSSARKSECKKVACARCGLNFGKRHVQKPANSAVPSVLKAKRGLLTRMAMSKTQNSAIGKTLPSL
jgi:hypothetical protein